MTNIAPFQVIDVEVSPGDVTDDNDVIIDLVISELRPKWKKEDIASRALSGGLSNILRCYHLKSDTSHEDAIVVRIYPPRPSDNPIVRTVFRRDCEFVSFQLGARIGACPTLLAAFRNGIVYEFSRGGTVRGPDLHNPKAIRAVARAVAEFHSADIKANMWDTSGKKINYPEDNSYFPFFQRIFKSFPDEVPDPEINERFQREFGKPASHWASELTYMTKIASEIPITHGLIHNDLHTKNIIIDHETGTAKLVDTEISCVGPVLVDFGGLYLDRDYRHAIPFNDDERPEPEDTEETKKLWHLEYLKRKYELQGRDPDNVTEYDLKKLYLESAILEPCFHLRWVMILYFLLNFSHIEFPVFECLRIAENKYAETKVKVPGLVKQLLEHIQHVK